MKKEINKRVVIYSLIAMLFLLLTFTIDWLFIIPAVVLMLLNQRYILDKKQL